MELVGNYVQFSSKLNGRDKTLRLIQYTSKFIANVAKDISKNKSTAGHIQTLKSLQNVLSMTRKTLRLGKTIDTIYGIVKATATKDPVLASLLVATKISRSCYFFFDTMSWLVKVGIMDGDGKGISSRSTWFWCLTLLLGVVRDFYELKNYLDTQKNVKNFDSKYLGLKYFILWNLQVLLDLTKNLFDLIVALQMMDKLDVSDSVTGFAGMMSSLVGIFEICYPQYKLVPS